MLIGDPKKRLTAKELCEQLRSIMKQSAAEQRIIVRENIKAYLLEVDDAALSKPRDSILVGIKTTSDRSVAIVESRKERLLGLPLMKTTHRAIASFAVFIHYQGARRRRIKLSFLIS